MKILPTKVIDNFFSDEDFRYLKSLPFVYSHMNHPTDYDPIFEYKPYLKDQLPLGLVRRYLSFNDHPDYSKVTKILNETVEKHFGTDIKIRASHILTAFYPYLTHTDAVYGEYGIDDTNFGAYTLIIPLDTFLSSTIIYNEYSDKTKVTSVYMEDHEPINKIDDEFYEKYLTHEARENMRYLSVEKVFNWNSNSCLAMSRYKFHGSDDFFSHGIPYKQALIMWTSAHY